MALAQHAPLILASGSTIRQQMLKAVGLTFSVEPSGVDEDIIKRAYVGESIPALGLALARAKALAVSAGAPAAYTIGADQLCVRTRSSTDADQNERVLSKPGSYERAEAQLAELSGKTHEQHCAVVIARGDDVVWEHTAVATLTMRTLTADEIRAYVAADAPLQSCGAYKFEALGRHLFSTVVGDHDVIQGLALVPLLAELHRQSVIGFAAPA